MRGRNSIRIPIHGFVEFDDWEKDILNHKVFQRLRRIRQLALSEHIYPGSTHTRFEHSLGVLHVATRMFDVLRKKHDSLMRDRLSFDDQIFERCRSLVRLAALLHDVGHAPLSHSGEHLMPLADGVRIEHEDYSFYLIAESMKDVIDDHPLNRERMHITGREVASFYLGMPDVSANILKFRDLVSGQLDADRMDYLLRDSHHCGVTYGFYDLDRILDTLTFVKLSDDDPPDLKVGIEDGGRHAAEGLILARYFMFEQVYFQKTRMAYDHHGAECLRESLVPSGTLPDPSIPEGREAYLKLDDWHLFEAIRGSNSRHAVAILRHQHDREIAHTPEVALPDQLAQHDRRLKTLRDNGIPAWDADASKSWYKSGSTEILIAHSSTKTDFSRGRPLTAVSETAGKVRDSTQRRLYVPHDQRDGAKDLIADLPRGDGHGHA